jgi:methionine-rich copper-binding protein CopC
MECPMMIPEFRFRAFATIALAALAACSSSTAPMPSTAVSSVSPAGGATAVTTSTSFTMTFSDSMMLGMEAYVSMHRGTVSGPVVPMTGHWSGDHRQLTMTPNAALAPGTMYFVHMGGGMMDGNSQPIDYSQCSGFGGQSATSSMMGGSMGGMAGEMGTGWAGTDGNYGMMFSFTTS